jgi:transcriptional regulator with GAF, ATPase, and Fis domain
MADFEAGTTNVIQRPSSSRVACVELAVIEGPDTGRRLRIEQGSLRIGSAAGNQLALADRAVSRLHCEITVRSDGVSLRDLGSTNGTWVDGNRARDVDLSPNSLVRVGATTLRVEFVDQPLYLELSPHAVFGDVIGQSVEMRRVFATLEKAAATDATILIQGETGTGKELVAQAVHEASRRATGPFVTVDCGAMPEALMESELFGHVRGAFTGAVNDRKGAFEEAEGGTLFFDEIGELPLTLQPKLLRALESRQVRRVGTNVARPVDVRVLAATNRSLARCVNDGSFREDLYYRLAVVEIELPPLRARREDIPLLASRFMERFTGAPTPVPPEALSVILARSWPGNVRELRNFIERSISVGWRAATSAPPRPSEALPGGPAAPATRPSRPPQSDARGGEPAVAMGTSDYGPELSALLQMPLKDARLHWTEKFESIYVRALLARSGGSVTRAAELGGVSRRFLQRTMVRLGMRSSENEE